MHICETFVTIPHTQVISNMQLFNMLVLLYVVLFQGVTIKNLNS